VIAGADNGETALDISGVPAPNAVGWERPTSNNFQLPRRYAEELSTRHSDERPFSRVNGHHGADRLEIELGLQTRTHRGHRRSLRSSRRSS